MTTMTSFRTVLQKYWMIIIISFQEALIYREHFALEMIGLLFTRFLALVLWIALFAYSGQSVLGGYTRGDMIVYLIGAGLIESIFHINSQGDAAMNDINRGTLNTYLLKPVSVQWYWFVKDMARKALMLFVGGAAALVMILFFRNAFVIPQGMHIAVFIIMFLLGAVLHYLFFHLFSLCAFWMGLTWGLSFIFRVLMALATGGLIPLDLFPESIRQLFLALPFQFFGYAQMQTLLGRFSTTAIGESFLLLVLWIIGCAALSHILFRKGLRAYGAYGG